MWKPFFAQIAADAELTVTGAFWSGALEARHWWRLVAALFAGSRHHGIELHFNKGLAGAPAEAIAAAADTATHPQVRTAFALAIIAAGGPPAYPGLPGAGVDSIAGPQKARQVVAAMDELRKVAPNMGSYCSESSFFPT